MSEGDRAGERGDLSIYTNPRFEGALEEAYAAWAGADPVRCAGLAGCTVEGESVVVPFFDRRYAVAHPSGAVTPRPDDDAQGGTAKPTHAAIVILLLHYLLTADGTPARGEWVAFRDLPDGMFYASAFAARAEAEARRLIESAVAAGSVEALAEDAVVLGGRALSLADLSFGFVALPRLPVAVLLWQGDEEFAAEGRVLFDANAHHCLPTEDLAGLGDWLVHRLAWAPGRVAAARSGD